MAEVLLSCLPTARMAKNTSATRQQNQPTFDAKIQTETERTMKHYLVFIFENYYPSGGWGDFVDSFDTIERAYSEFEGQRAKIIGRTGSAQTEISGHIIDSQDGEIVF